MTPRWCVLVLPVIVSLLAACEAVNGPPPRLFGSGANTEWPYRPVEMRFHPLTRFASDAETSKLLIEARLEFVDSDGHTTRCFGEVTVMLAEVRPNAPLRLIDEWQINLADLAQNANHFDDVTRTYLLRLGVDREDLPERAELRAEYSGVDGATLRSTHRLDER